MKQYLPKSMAMCMWCAHNLATDKNNIITAGRNGKKKKKLQNKCTYSVHIQKCAFPREFVSLFFNVNIVFRSWYVCVSGISQSLSWMCRAVQTKIAFALIIWKST